MLQHGIYHNYRKFVCVAFVLLSGVVEISLGPVSFLYNVENRH
jgi:hypothetical protein